MVVAYDSLQHAAQLNDNGLAAVYFYRAISSQAPLNKSITLDVVIKLCKLCEKLESEAAVMRIGVD